jgi:hypothetical protein
MGLVSAVSELLREAMRPLGIGNYINLLPVAKRQIRRHLSPVGCPARLAIPHGEAENPAGRLVEAKESVLVRLGIPAIVVVALAACSSSAPTPPSDPTASAAIVKKDCADPKWREENLGLWYSVCRQPLRW